ncbi:MAG TPA: tetratricopeptide repeat protein [Vicinamibacterales bacterium]|jgi:TolA-binding protein|nr:tetratricopeptide repeat protein [Vicinamibacterales bacterium]
MKLRALPFALLTLLLAGASAPAHAADKETRQMMADIHMLEEQAQQNQTAITALVEKVDAMQKSLNARVDDQAETVRKSFADARTVTSQQSNDLRAIIERLNDNTTSIGKISAEIQAFRQLLVSRTTMTVPDSSSPAPATAAGAAPPDTTASASTAVGQSPGAVFDQAYGEYTQGVYDLAADGFTAFINAFPSVPQAADAQAYICASRYQAKQFREAVDACDSAVRLYPSGQNTPIASYRKGQAYQELRQNDDAKAAYDFTVKTYPTSDAATLAGQALTAMQRLAPAAQKRP